MSENVSSSYVGPPEFEYVQISLCLHILFCICFCLFKAIGFLLLYKRFCKFKHWFLVLIF